MSAQFCHLLRSGRVETVRSPNLNAFAERFVLAIRLECLSRMIFFGEDSLRRAVEEFVPHYNAERNHQSFSPRFRRFLQLGRSAVARRLGGLLNYYYRAATG